MPNRTAPFKQIDVTRFYKGAVNGGMDVAEIIMAPDGTMRAVAKGEQATSGKGSIDKMLDIK